ncbi:hypothetical protein ALFP_1661 [Alcaligenes faecalis]|uniref:hypothetical protein n=1 Tax=Alcaligenes faecalis TaxID=511 RepID=UPI0007C589B1|nr:hypothetical protein [Alcaligenes faecalis]ARP53548.1 hypothetical protein ALFP_1661 [Alcaligenes faecalis]
MGIKWEMSFHKVATVLATALCVLVSILALIFLFDGLANPQGQYAAINYVFAIVGVGFSSLIFVVNRYYSRVCRSLPTGAKRDARLLGWSLSVLYVVLIGLFMLGGLGIGARLLQDQHIFG